MALFPWGFSAEDFTLPHLFPWESYGTFFGTGLSNIYSPIGPFPTVFVQNTSDSIGIRHQTPSDSDESDEVLSESNGPLSESDGVRWDQLILYFCYLTLSYLILSNY